MRRSLSIRELHPTSLSFRNLDSHNPDFRTTLSMLLLALTVVVALAQMFPDFCRKMSPIVSVFCLFIDKIFTEDDM